MPMFSVVWLSSGYSFQIQPDAPTQLFICSELNLRLFPLLLLFPVLHPTVPTPDSLIPLSPFLSL